MRQRAPNHRWTPEEKEIIRREYEQSRCSREEIAARLGVTTAAVAGQVARMGLQKRTDRRPWIPEEDETLRQLVEKKPMTVIARRMHRSVNSVTVRSKRLNLSRRQRDGWHTMREAEEILGMDHHWILKRIMDGRLKANRHLHEGNQENARRTMWRIEEKELRRFIRRFAHELNGRNVDLMQVVQILSGLIQPESEEGRKPGSGTEPNLASISMRTGNGQVAFGMEKENGASPGALIMLEESNYQGIWKATDRVEADELAELLLDRRQGGKERKSQ